MLIPCTGDCRRLRRRTQKPITRITPDEETRGGTEQTDVKEMDKEHQTVSSDTAEEVTGCKSKVQTVLHTERNTE